MTEMLILLEIKKLVQLKFLV